MRLLATRTRPIHGWIRPTRLPGASASLECSRRWRRCRPNPISCLAVMASQNLKRQLWLRAIQPLLRMPNLRSLRQSRLSRNHNFLLKSRKKIEINKNGGDSKQKFSWTFPLPSNEAEALTATRTHDPNNLPWTLSVFPANECNLNKYCHTYRRHYRSGSFWPFPLSRACKRNSIKCHKWIVSTTWCTGRHM